jgi:hypothetical protein
MEVIELNSNLICPECGRRVIEVMPCDRCQHYHECTNSSALLKSKPRRSSLFDDTREYPIFSIKFDEFQLVIQPTSHLFRF